jgi:hypothetical protein
MVASSGGEDALLVWCPSSRGVVTLDFPAISGDAASAIDETKDEDVPHWIEAIRAKEAELAEAAEEKTEEEKHMTESLRNDVFEVRNKLQSLISNNLSPDKNPLEKLEREDFCIDHEQRDHVAAKTDQVCTELHQKISAEQASNQIIRNRYIEEFVKPMENSACALYSFDKNISVTNYPIRAVPEQENQKLTKLMQLRSIEALEREWLTSGSGVSDSLKHDVILDSKSFTSGEESYVVNWWPKPASSEDEATKKMTEDEMRLLQLQRACYEPFELVTDLRRRQQIFFLQNLGNIYRGEFNGLFETMQATKASVLQRIEDLCKQLKAGLAELKITDQKIPMPKVNNEEDSQKVLEVQDDEIRAEKWFSTEAKAEIERQRREEQEKERLLRENDMSRRALHQMMGGSLKTKKDLSPLERTVDKEDWISSWEDDGADEEELDEEQLEKLAVYRAAVDKLETEQAEYRKQVQANIQKCRQDIESAMTGFAADVTELRHQRYQKDAAIFCQELYMIRLYLKLVQNKHDADDSDKFEADIIKLEEEYNKIQEKVQAHEEIEAVTSKEHDEIQAKAKSLESQQWFNSHFQLDSEDLRELYRLFKKAFAGAPAAGSGLAAARSLESADQETWGYASSMYDKTNNHMTHHFVFVFFIFVMQKIGFKVCEVSGIFCLLFQK